MFIIKKNVNTRPAMKTQRDWNKHHLLVLEYLHVNVHTDVITFHYKDFFPLIEREIVLSD